MTPRQLFADRDWRALSVITPFILRHRWQVALAALCLVLITLCTLAVPYLMKLIVDELAHSDQVAVPYLLGCLIAYGVIRFLSVLFRELRDAIFGRVSVRAMRRLSVQVLRHLHQLDLEYHLARRTGAISRDLDRGVNSVASLMRIMVFSIIPELMQVIGITAILLALFHWWFAVITFVAVTIYVIYTLRVTEWRTPMIRAANLANSKANNRAIDSLINYETVKQFGNENIEARLYDTDLKVWELARKRNRNSLAMLNVGQWLLTTVGITLMLAMASFDILSGDMTVGDLVLISSYGSQVFIQLNNLGGTYREFKGCLTDIELMFDILELTPKVSDAPNAQALPNDHTEGAIEFRQVSFRYHPERPILHQISFSVPAGGSLAIVGPSGAGKSTISRLLFRFYDPDEGAILLNGVDIRQIKLASLRESLAIVPQDTTLFNASLFENIAYGDPEASHDRVYEAARMAHLDELISRLPDGFDTVVGERGLKLSGGEKQRVAIARAILKRPRVLVFDEATSSLDSASEQAILSAIAEVSAGHTRLVIAHRLSTIADADHILVLDHGEIAESGTHFELLSQQGLYAELWEMQRAERGDESNKLTEIRQLTTRRRSG